MTVCAGSGPGYGWGCADVPSFVDVGGYGCSDWTGSDCSVDPVGGVDYSAADLAAVQLNCPYSCGRCGTGVCRCRAYAWAQCGREWTFILVDACKDAHVYCEVHERR